MRIHIGSDHAGLDFKGVIIKHLESNGHEVIDHGPHSFDPLDDYGAPNAGCTSIEWLNPRTREWEIL